MAHRRAENAKVKILTFFNSKEFVLQVFSLFVIGRNYVTQVDRLKAEDC